MEQLVAVPKIVVELGEAESYGPPSAADTAVAESAGEARPPGAAKRAVPRKNSKSQCLLAKLGLLGQGKTRPAHAAVAQTIGEARPSEIAQRRGDKELSDLKEWGPNDTQAPTTTETGT